MVKTILKMGKMLSFTHFLYLYIKIRKNCLTLGAVLFILKISIGLK